MVLTLRFWFLHRLLAAVIAAAVGLGADSTVAQVAPNVVQLEQEAMQKAVATVAPSVVRIETLGGLDRVDDQLTGTGPTTGLIVSGDGFIVSSAFNFVRKPASILVVLADGRRLPAKLVATDHNRMIVLLKVEANSPLTVPKPAAEDGVRPGQWAVALGRTYDAPEPNISVGIVSATDRVWGKAVQTDAKISPSNYGGPLVNIRGEVLGVLVPLSPDSTSELAGTEWYDSGIGFAIPLTDIDRVLPRLKQGEDLQPGLLGVSLRGSDVYADAPVIAATAPQAPARAAGLRKGDAIVEVDGITVSNQSELKHQLAARYAGDRIKLAVRRNDGRVEFEATLVDKLPVYEYPYLGVLLNRQEKAAVVRYVFPDTPAARAGLQPGDSLQMLGKDKIDSRSALVEALAQLVPGDRINLTFRRGEETLTLDVEFAPLPSSTPSNVPPAVTGEGESPAQAATGVARIKLPEFSSDSLAFVPESYDPSTPHGLVVWLHGAGDIQDQPLVDRWRAACVQRGLILLAPRAADPARWQRTEVEFILKSIGNVLSKYTIDRSRIAVCGEDSGGSMAFLTGIAGRDIVRGIAVSGAMLPSTIELEDNNPLRRLSLLIATEEKPSPTVLAAIDRIRSQKYPLSVISGGRTKPLSGDRFTELVRWIDSLDAL